MRRCECINSVSFENGLKLRQHPDTLLHLRKLNDEICAAHGFSTLKPYEKGGTKISAREYRTAVSGASWKFQLMYHIGEAMKRSPDKKTFIQEMKKRGYGVTWTEERKYITYTCPNGKKCRGIKLHEEKYKKEMIVNTEQAQTVRLIYDLYLDGWGLVKIKDELELRGIKTAMGKSQWYPTVISHVLKNSFY